MSLDVGYFRRASSTSARWTTGWSDRDDFDAFSVTVPVGPATLAGRGGTGAHVRRFEADLDPSAPTRFEPAPTTFGGESSDLEWVRRHSQRLALRGLMLQGGLSTRQDSDGLFCDLRVRSCRSASTLYLCERRRLRWRRHCPDLGLPARHQLADSGEAHCLYMLPYGIQVADALVTAGAGAGRDLQVSPARNRRGSGAACNAVSRRAQRQMYSSLAPCMATGSIRSTSGSPRLLGRASSLLRLRTMFDLDRPAECKLGHAGAIRRWARLPDPPGDPAGPVGQVCLPARLLMGPPRSQGEPL